MGSVLIQRVSFSGEQLRSVFSAPVYAIRPIDPMGDQYRKIASKDGIPLGTGVLCHLLSQALGLSGVTVEELRAAFELSGVEYKF